MSSRATTRPSGSNGTGTYAKGPRPPLRRDAVLANLRTGLPRRHGPGVGSVRASAPGSWRQENLRGHPRRLGRDDVAEPWAQAGAAAPRQRSRLISRIVAFPTPGACRATARLALSNTGTRCLSVGMPGGAGDPVDSEHGRLCVEVGGRLRGARGEAGAGPEHGPGSPHATGATTSPTARPAAEAMPGDDARRQRPGELDYRPCCTPRTMRISRTPSSTWAVPSATKPCLR